MGLLLATRGPDGRVLVRSGTLWCQRAVICGPRTRLGALNHACHVFLLEMSPSAKLSVTRNSRCREQRASACTLRPHFRNTEKQSFRMPVNRQNECEGRSEKGG